MNRRVALLRAISLAAFGFIASVGCNGLLGNDEGTPRGPDAGAPAEAGGSTEAGGAVCDTTAGHKVCFGLCVTIDQPNTGCAGNSCDACDLKNVVASSCKGGSGTFSCGYDTCKPTYDDCDGQRTNGCETSLAAKASCGSCTTKCEGPTPFCALTSPGAASCVASCPPGTQDCDGSCVNTENSPQNCGGCGLACERAGATGTCVNSGCVFQCKAGTHECGDLCVSDLDPQHCGGFCRVCPAPGPYTTPTCNGGNCDATCVSGHLDCDGDMSNGCEVFGLTCPVAGGCGHLPCPPDKMCCNGACIDLDQICPISI